MTDNNKNASDPNRYSGHKSQGMRTKSKSEKMAREDAIADKIIEDLDADRTIRIDTVQPKGDSSGKKAGAQASSREEASSQEETSSQEAAVSEKVSRVFEADKTGEADSLGITVYVNREDIPAYEIGLSSSEFYVSDEIKNGKVSKISEEQLAEMEAEALKKKHRKAASAGTKKNGKKKLTPVQKAVHVVIWLAFWAVVFMLAFMVYRVGYDVFYDVAVDPSSTSTIEYTVEAGATDESVYDDLIRLGVIDCEEYIYKLRALVFDAEYIEGTYTISAGYNTEKIINILAGYNYSDDDE